MKRWAQTTSLDIWNGMKSGFRFLAEAPIIWAAAYALVLVLILSRKG